MRLVFFATIILLSGCESISYYRQAIGGHLELMAASRPIGDWLADPQTSPELRRQLETAQRVREFASRDLALPDNRSYRSYANLGRPYAVWNVFAAPALSVEPRVDCFPFAGCVSYRGFFAEVDARRHAARLRAEGNDVHLSGVPAYSTLGWLDDPLLSSFIRYPDWQLARLLFHELAHQVAYADNDTTFNESFAVVVEQEGVRRWILAQGREADLAAFRSTQARRGEFSARVTQTREQLDRIYRSAMTAAQKLEHKRAAFDRLRLAYPQIVPAEPNNAFLASIAVYTGLIPAFERLLAEAGSLQGFYQRVRELAATERSIRDPLLARRR